jgi:putative CocE/NonD family hydrolase
MKRIMLSFLLACCLHILSAQNKQDEAWIRENYIKKEVRITMRDGIKLFTSYYIPKDTTELHPILFMRTPYSCAPYGEDTWAPLWSGHFRYYLREGYILAIQDVRGRWMSEGEFVDVRPFNPNKKTNKNIDEASDTYDAIDWLIKNLPHNNGKVGVTGISYPGFYSTMAALSGHPALKAVSPQAPVTDWFIGDDFHHNGAFFQMDGFAFYSSFGKPRPHPTTVGPAPFDYPTQDNYKFYLETGTLRNLSKLMGDSIAFWKDLYAHPNYDDWWKARNVRNFVNNVPPGTSTLIVGGLFDAEDCFGAWKTYEAIEQKAKNNNKIVMGPWYHGQWSSSSDDGSSMGNVQFGSSTSTWYQNNIEIPYFNYHLKGKGDISKLPEATIFFTGTNQWKQFEQWPPASKQNRSIYLHAGGKLSWEKASGKNSYSEYISDPSKPVPYTEDIHFQRTKEYMTDDQRFASRRPDVLVFQTGVLSEDITLAGPIVADLLTSISTTDADFVVKLIDVFPDKFNYADTQSQRVPDEGYLMDGYQMLVRGEIMRGKFRKSFETPVPFKPNSLEKIRYELPDVAHTFQKGHRIMIQIQSSWFPLADRNPQKFVNIYEANENDFQKSTIRIYHDASNASQIILPVIK